jgi:hypothetical protein
LARYWIKFYGKKRGDRRSGSSQLRSAGAGCFWGLFFLVGCGGLATVLTQLTIPELRVNRDFIEHACRVTDRRIHEIEDEDGPLYAPEFRLQYEIDGQPYSPWASYEITKVHTRDRARSEAILKQFEIGAEYPCWIDPRDPARVVLKRGYTWFAWLALLFPVPFLAIGGGGLFYVLWNWGKSAERRAVLSKRPARHYLFDDTGGVEPRFPYVPSDADLSDSPGTKLAFRLPAASAGWSLLALALVALAWNLVVAFWAVKAVDSHLAGDPDWFQTLFLIPFALIGLGLIVAIVRQVLIGTGAGPTIVEISGHPLYPGRQYELFISQTGRLKLEILEVLLVCEEEATYRQGTDTRTATRRVCQRRILRREAPAVRPGEPLELTATLDVPAGAMHSFRADHNRVHWRLIIQGKAPRRSGFERSFRLNVNPAAGGGEAV